MALEDLRIYKTALQAADLILQESKSWDHRSISLIGDQLVRAVVSVTNNISEAYARVATGERVQLLMYAEGSSLEARNAIVHAIQLGCIRPEIGREAQKLLATTSIGIIEFAWSIASRDPGYKSPMKAQLEKRHNGIMKARTR
ncbi:MAG: four helix bundle protein [Ignavibacteriae bacterium]|nr:MAG: four helix bundle protein [Ignavibacteriota bacterium]